MSTFLIRQDMDAYRPTHWAGTVFERRYGPHNEGVTVQARDLDDAKTALREGRYGPLYRLNPFFVLIEPVNP